MRARSQFDQHTLRQPAPGALILRRTFLIHHPFSFGAGLRQGPLKLLPANHDLPMQQAAAKKDDEGDGKAHRNGDSGPKGCSEVGQIAI